MSLVTDLYLARWQAIVPGLPYNPTFAIPTYWLHHQEIGSPLGPEIDLTEDQSTPATAGQAFANGIILWSATRGTWSE